jgi:hypothetical protein
VARVRNVSAEWRQQSLGERNALQVLGREASSALLDLQHARLSSAVQRRLTVSVGDEASNLGSFRTAPHEISPIAEPDSGQTDDVVRKLAMANFLENRRGTAG